MGQLESNHHQTIASGPNNLSGHNHRFTLRMIAIHRSTWRLDLLVGRPTGSSDFVVIILFASS
jgi:hypothetical protein